MKKTNRVNTGGMFDYWHNNAPAPFNPDFIPWARDCQTISTYLQTKMEHEEGREWSREERAMVRKSLYTGLMKKGKPLASTVKEAKNWLYNNC